MGLLAKQFTAGIMRMRAVLHGSLSGTDEQLKEILEEHHWIPSVDDEDPDASKNIEQILAHVPDDRRGIGKSN